MISRSLWTAALLLAAGLCGTAPAQAEGLREFFKGVAQDTARRNCWPTPFLYPARQAAREPFANMVANGWERENMLNDQHFEPDTSKLNAAGQAKVRWILSEVPEQHRRIFIHRDVIGPGNGRTHPYRRGIRRTVGHAQRISPRPGIEEVGGRLFRRLL